MPAPDGRTDRRRLRRRRAGNCRDVRHAHLRHLQPFRRADQPLAATGLARVGRGPAVPRRAGREWAARRAHGAGAVVVPAPAVDAVGVALTGALEAQATGPELLAVLLESKVGALLVPGERDRGGWQFAQVEGFLDQDFVALSVDVQDGRAAP